MPIFPGRELYLLWDVLSSAARGRRERAFQFFGTGDTGVVDDVTIGMVVAVVSSAVGGAAIRAGFCPVVIGTPAAGI